MGKRKIEEGPRGEVSFVSWNTQKLSKHTTRKATLTETVKSSADHHFFSEVVIGTGGRTIAPSERKTTDKSLHYQTNIRDARRVTDIQLPASTQEMLRARRGPWTYAGFWGTGRERYPLYMGKHEGVHVYGIHSKSGPTARQVLGLAVLIKSIENRHPGGHWMVMGDLNVDPTRLRETVRGLSNGDTSGIHFVVPDRPTRQGPVRTREGPFVRESTLDFAVSSHPEVRVEALGRLGHRSSSDHRPVRFSWRNPNPRPTEPARRPFARPNKRRKSGRRSPFG